MSAKEIKHGAMAREKMMKGVDAMANAVKVTLGPKGRNVLINKSWGSPKITKDGVTVAKELELKDRFENIGAQMVRQVAIETSDEAGDGTTTATILARAIYRQGARLVAAGANPMPIKRGIDKAVDLVVGELRNMSKPTKEKNDIARVGTISANNDDAIGDMIAEAMEKVGKEGVITVLQHVMEGIGSFGFNAETGAFEDLMAAGIVDPTKVSRLALENAASVAGLFITTEAMIAEKPGKMNTSARSVPSDDMY